MIKQIMSFILLIGTILFSFPVECKTIHYCKSKDTLEISGGASKFIQGVTGVTLVSYMAGKNQIKKEVAKDITGDVDVQYKIFSGLDLAEGKLKKLRITGNNIRFKKFNTLNIEKFELKSTCSPVVFNIANKKDLHDSLYADFTFVIHEQDLNSAVRHGFVLNGLRPVALNLPTLGKIYFDFIMPTIEIINNKVVLSTNIKGLDPNILRFIPNSVNLTPFVHNGMIQMKNLNFGSKNGKSMVSLAKSLENELTTLYNFKKLASNKFTIYPSNIKVQKPYIILKGTISIHE